MGESKKKHTLNHFCLSFLIVFFNINQTISRLPQHEVISSKLKYIISLCCSSVMRSIKIVPICIPLSMSVKATSVYCARHESVEKFALKRDWYFHVDKWRRFNFDATSCCIVRCLIEVESTSRVYWFLWSRTFSLRRSYKW